jgi:citrate lyase beta subunit
MRKAFANPQLDVMVIDLEDAVSNSPEAKNLGRENVRSFLDEVARSDLKRELAPNLVLRINCPHTTPYGLTDLQMVTNLQHVDAVLLPKAESAANVASVSQNMNKPVWCMIETPLGVQNVDDISRVEAVDCLVFGSNDLTKDLKAVLEPLMRQPLLYSMSRTILAARAAGKLVVDGVFMDISKAGSAGLQSTCEQGKQLGFDGKSLIHPTQIGVANSTFSPTEQDVNMANRIIEAYRVASHAGKGVCVLDGRLIEALHVEASEELLARVKHIETRNAGAAKQ